MAEGPLSESEEDMDSEERLLYAARNGEVKTVSMLIEKSSKGEIELNINCKGKIDHGFGAK